MKFLALLIIVIATAVLVFSFFEHFTGVLRGEVPVSNNAQSFQSPNETQKNISPTSTSSGFHGPSGKPGAGFIGPKSNPPNY